MEEKLKQVIQEIRYRLQMDGGDIELVGVEGDKALVRLKGACACCPSASFTLAAMVERVIKEKVPEIKEVVAV